VARIKNMPRFAWFIIGIAVTVVLVPSVAVAAGLKFTGIEGVSKNQADVTPANQLLTTEASPTKFVQYIGIVEAAYGGSGCSSLATIPAGDSFVIQQVQADVSQADQPQYFSYTNYLNQTAYDQTSDSSFSIDYGGACPDPTNYIITGEAPAGGVGNVTTPLQPGFVLPSGTNLSATAVGMSATLFVSGYLVPSADAPSITPRVVKHADAGRLPAHHVVTPTQP
jgi:hypothetical protein